jgi:hypothetical protein
MRHRPTPSAILAALTLAVPTAAPAPARAQHAAHPAAPASDSTEGATRARWHLMGQAIPVVTHAANTIGGASLTEFYLSQAAAMARGDLWRGRLRLEATLNAEGATMERG